jgi:hypothetical protein
MDPSLKRMKSDPQSESLLVWFQLIDSTTGESYKETSASSILRSCLVVPVIDQFRDTVKAKFSNTLLSVDSGTLLVYKNQAAFIDSKDPPEEDALLGALGTSKQEALIVVFPSLIQAQEDFPSTKRQKTAASGSMIRLPFSDGLNPLGPYFDRQAILTRMFNWITGKEGDKRFLLLNSPTASGKTSLLTHVPQHKLGDSIRFDEHLW